MKPSMGLNGSRTAGLRGRFRASPRVSWCVGVCIGLVALATHAAEPDGAAQRAQQLAQKYPPGSILTDEQAQHALVDSAQVHEQLQAEFDAQRIHCTDVFFATHCLETARAAQREGEAVVRRVALEAHDLRRHADARLHDQSRAAELQRQARDEALRPQREQEALQATQARMQSAAAREEDERKDAEAARKNQAATEQRLQTQQASQSQKEQKRPSQETEAEQAYRKKQIDAAEYARGKAEDKKVNEQKRADRQAEREAQNRADEAQKSKGAVPPP
jgi:hypothetical protein